MKNEIVANLDNPKKLETLYRKNPKVFKRTLNEIYPDYQNNLTVQIWNERLSFQTDEINWGSKSELTFIIIVSVIAGIFSELSNIFSIDPDFFYPRNIPLIVFSSLICYFAWKKRLDLKRIVIMSVIILFSALFINLLPRNSESDTLLLSSIHLPLFLWIVLSFVYVSDNPNDLTKRLDFLKYNGDLIVMTAIILLASILFSAITFLLFSLIGFQLKEFYAEYIAVLGITISPLLGTYLIQTNPHLVNKVSSVIAKIFTPLVLVTLIFYLIAMILSGKNPYSNREFLLAFNILLVGVMAIIFFSIAESSKHFESKFHTIMLFTLSIVTIIVNGIALSAILFRISEWGITPNRLAVLGSNILILTNLVIVAYKFSKTLKDKTDIESVINGIVSYLPVYGIWTILITFIFPLIFGFK